MNINKYFPRIGKALFFAVAYFFAIIFSYLIAYSVYNVLIPLNISEYIEYGLIGLLVATCWGVILFFAEVIWKKLGNSK